MPHGECTTDGLNMMLSFATKVYDVYNGAFDAVDAKAGALIGYVAIAASIQGVVTTRGTLHPMAALVGLGAFLLAILCALGALLPRSMAGGAPPSPQIAVDYWLENGDTEGISKLVVGIENAQDELYRVTSAKFRWLLAGYALVGVGFIGLVASVVPGIV